MAAREDQAETIVFYRISLIEIGRGDHRSIKLIGGRGQRGIEARGLAQTINGFEAPGGDQPRARILRHAVARPGIERGDKGVMQRLLGEIEIAEKADECGEHAARIGAIDRVDWTEALARFVCIGRSGCTERGRIDSRHGDQGAIAQIGRTSIEPNFAEGMREAT